MRLKKSAFDFTFTFLIDRPNKIPTFDFLFLVSVITACPQIIPPDKSCGCDGISQISKLIFDLQQKIEHKRYWSQLGL